MYMELEDDEREADYQALIADVEMLETKDDTAQHPAEEDMGIGQHILYKSWLLR